MKVALKIILVLLILLSISTGLVKIAQMDEEMVLYRGAGWSDLLIILFGVIQLIGGLMLLLVKTRKNGALLMTLTYIIATVVVFINQMWIFGITSILFIAMSYIIYKRPIQLFNDKI